MNPYLIQAFAGLGGILIGVLLIIFVLNPWNERRRR